MNQRGFEAGRIVSFLITTCILVLSSRCAWGEERISVAVLPFSASIDNKELEGLDRALSEMLITDLTAVQSIELVERARLNEFLKEIQLGKEGFVDPSTAATIGKGVGAKAILTGSFFAKGDKLRIDARLIHVESGTVLVAEEITGSSADPFELEKKLQQKLIDAMGVRLSALEKAEIATKPDADVGAAAAYGRAQALNEAGERDAAKAEAEKALRMAPNFKQAKTLLDALEERVSQIEEDVVAVKEVRLKRVRESDNDDFLLRHLKDPEIEVRLEAAVRLKSHSSQLAEMAKEEVRAFEASGDVIDDHQFSLAMVLVNKLDDEEALTAILFDSTHPLIKALALSKIRTRERLKNAFLGGMGGLRAVYAYPGETAPKLTIPDPTKPFWWWDFVVSEARRRIADQGDILELCKAGDRDSVKLLSDQHMLADIATSRDLDKGVVAQAQEQLQNSEAYASFLDSFQEPEKIDQLLDLVAGGQNDRTLRIAVSRLTNPRTLMRVVLRTASDNRAIALLALRKISDVEILRAAALSDLDDQLRTVAACRISDPSVLEAISAGSRGSKVAEACEKLRAYLAMSDEAKSEAISNEEFNEDHQEAFVSRINREDVLQDMLSEQAVHAPPRGYRLSDAGTRAAIRGLFSQVFLQNLILETHDDRTRIAAFDRIMELPDWESMDDFLIKVAAVTSITWRDQSHYDWSASCPLYYADAGDGRWGLYKFTPFVRWPGENQETAYELSGVLDGDPGVERRRQAFLRIQDYSRAEKDFIAVYDDYVQQRLTEKLGEEYTRRAISLALREKRYVPPSVIEGCSDQALLCAYMKAIGDWDDNFYGNVPAARAELALLSKITDASVLSDNALRNANPAARDISISRLEDKSALDKIAAESLYFDTQRMAREKLARLP